MKTVARWALLGGVGLAWVALGVGRPAAAPPVSVEYVPPHLTVRVPETTDLHTVLMTVCAQTQARCELAAPAAAVPVAPTTVTGSWVEVVTKLVAAAGLNVTAAPAADGHGAQLVVLGRSAPAGAPAAPAPPPFAAPPGIPLGFLVPPPAPPATTMVLPFHDASGNPIVVPIPHEPLKVLPFPGPDRQPVPVPPPPPGQKLGWPFPPTVGAPNL